MLPTNLNKILICCILSLAVRSLGEKISVADPIPLSSSIVQNKPNLITTKPKLPLHSDQEQDQEDESSSSSAETTATFFSNEFASSEYYDELNNLTNDDVKDYDANNDDDNDVDDQPNHEWDILIFTQQWPVTTCYHWREEDKTHPCSLPNRKEFWTIHGIWPTKLRHIGPSFCNKTLKFNVEQLEEIKEKLELYWPVIDAKATYDWLWKHEWLKHGTCAAILEKLNNELKYFSQGLIWRSRYLVSNMLGGAGIHPDSNNTIIAIQTALFNELGKNPAIYCIYDNEKDISFLSEIRICFNKTLQLTDCDGIKRGDAVSIDYPGGKVNTNCHISKPVHYPSIVPPTLDRDNREREWKFPFVNFYKLLQFIMWFTL